MLARQAVTIDAEAHATLQRCLKDPNLHVAAEATLALAEHSDIDRVAGLEAATRSGSFHLRAAAARALGNLGQRRAARRLQEFDADASPTVRLAALGARLKLGTLAQPLDAIMEAAASHPQLRAGAPALLAELGGDAALAQLLALAEDPTLGVARTALGALVSFPDESTHATLLRFLRSPDNSLRLAAIDAPAGSLRPEDLEALAQAHGSAQGDIVPEVGPQDQAGGRGRQGALRARS